MSRRQIVAWLERNEHYIASIALVWGFVFDNLMLRRIDVWLDNIMLVTYLSVFTCGIILIDLYDADVIRGRRLRYARAVMPFPMQFVLGGVFSICTVFYLRSASIATSWLFLLLLLGMLIGNEFFRSRYTQFNFQFSVLFIAVFSYSVFAVPIALGKMGPDVFLQSGLVSLAIISTLILIFIFFIPHRIKKSARALAISIGSIYIAMNMLYFFNIIPPVPLSLKDSGVYHSITRSPGGIYTLTQEPASWYRQFFGGGTIHLISGEPAYFFSSVFAPTRLSTEIVHRWEYYDGQKGQWVTSLKIQFPIYGGRDGGYRGYSLKTSLSSGLWRVSVETARGQVLGRRQFTIETVSMPPQLETITN
jgi:hypothetical protein